MSSAQSARSALAHVASLVGVDADSSQAGISLHLAPVQGLLQIRALHSRDNVSTALQAHIGIGLSDRLQSLTQDAYCVRWMSPDSWLLSCPLAEVPSMEQTLRMAVSEHLALVDVSGGFTVLRLRGEHAQDVLMKSTPYDVHPDHFTRAKVVNTNFAKTQVTLRCVALGEYELIVRRSYSDYVWVWLQRAAAEYGLQVVTTC